MKNNLRKGYYIIPGFEKYAINKEGEVYNIKTYRDLKPEKVGNSVYYNINGDKVCRKSREYLLNTTFMDFSDYKLIPGFENYMINRKGEVYNVKTRTKLNGNMYNGEIHYYLRSNNIKKHKSKEMLINMTFKDLSDYKLIPGFENYMINRKGEVYNVKIGLNVEGVKRQGTVYYNLTSSDGKERLAKSSTSLVNLTFGNFEGYREIPGYSGYIINEEGKLYNKSRKKLKTTKYKGRPYVTLYDDSGKRCFKSISTLVSLAFQNLEGYRIIEGYPNYVINKEGIIINTKSMNRLYGSKNTVSLYNTEEKSSKRFYIPSLINYVFNTNKDILNDYISQGYKEIPEFENYVVNIQGVVVNYKKGNVISIYTSKKGIRSVKLYCNRSKRFKTRSIDKILVDLF